MRCRLLLWAAGLLLALFAPTACGAQAVASAVVVVRVRVEPRVTLPPPEFDWGAFELHGSAWARGRPLTNDPRLCCRSMCVRESGLRPQEPIRERRVVWVVLPGE